MMCDEVRGKMGLPTRGLNVQGTNSNGGKMLVKFHISDSRGGGEVARRDRDMGTENRLS